MIDSPVHFEVGEPYCSVKKANRCATVGDVSVV